MMTKLERAKRKTCKTWRGLLRDLPGMTRNDFDHLMLDATSCGFCIEYRSKWWTGRCPKCPIESLCAEMDGRWGKIYGKRYWRKPAADLCRWVLRKIDKVKED